MRYVCLQLPDFITATLLTKPFRPRALANLFLPLIGSTAVQRGPLWWAAHHRHHHVHSDEIIDAHSPTQHGFLWSHLGWFLSQANFVTQIDRVKELAKFPELRFLDRFDITCPDFFCAQYIFSR